MTNVQKLKVWMLITPIMLSLIFPINVIVKKTKVVAETKTEVIWNCPRSWNANEVKPWQIIINKWQDWWIIDTFYMWKKKFAVTSIPEWKLKIYNELWISEEHKLMLHTLNSLECWDWNWFCIGYNHADAWPFQINQIHWKDHTYSEYLVKQWRIAYDNSLKTWEWTTTNSIRDTLFRFQTKWTIARMETFRKKCKADKLKDIMYCQAVRHNWNTIYMPWYWQFRYWYWEKAKIQIQYLYDYYITK